MSPAAGTFHSSASTLHRLSNRFEVSLRSSHSYITSKFSVVEILHFFIYLCEDDSCNIHLSQAMIDVCAESAWLATTLRTQQLMQQVVQARWAHGSPILTLPFVEPQHMYRFAKLDDPSLSTLPGLREACFNNYEKLASILRGDFDDGEIEQVASSCLCSLLY